MSCSSVSDLSLTLSFQVLSAQRSAWADKLARSLQCTDKLMSALGYGCLQINLRIGIFQLQSSQQFHWWSLLCIALCVFILGKMENLKLK